MNLIILNKDFDPLYIVDTYKSFIWTDRYNEIGDFELYLPMSVQIFQYFQYGYYLKSDNSDRLMIIENSSITTDSEGETYLIINGRSLESILLRRIVWEQTELSGGQGGIETQIIKLLNDAIISPERNSRTIDNFIYEASGDSRISSIYAGKKQFTGDVLYDAIKQICDEHNIGFKITLNQNNQFVFKLYIGIDRSCDQSDEDFVIFSPNYDNLISSEYKIDHTNYRNVALIGGEGEGAYRRFAEIENGVMKGINRYELFVDARDLSSQTDDGRMPMEEYFSLLLSRGSEKLYEAKIKEELNASIDYDKQFVFNRDYFLGDIIQIENGFGISARARIMENIQSTSDNGFEQYPAFDIL